STPQASGGTGVSPGAAVLRPRVVVLPRRATLEGFGFLVDQFRAWAGAGSLADPGGRARIWAELAPRVPKRDEERALVALALLRRAIPALMAIHRAPATTPTERREWCSLDRTGGRLLLLHRLHPLDPPRPVPPPPGDPAALGLRTQTLNALFEVWVSQAVRAAVRRRVGLVGPLGAPLPRGGAEESATPRGRVRVCFDRVYPQPGRDPESRDGIVALT